MLPYRRGIPRYRGQGGFVDKSLARTHTLGRLTIPPLYGASRAPLRRFNTISTELGETNGRNLGGVRVFSGCVRMGSDGGNIIARGRHFICG